jgi:ArsR family transcriptional regulator
MRLELLQILARGERTVSSLAETAGTTGPNVSKHLRVLEEAGFVRRRQEGNSVVCALADRTVFALCDILCRNIRGRLLAQADLLTPAHPLRRLSHPGTSARRLASTVRFKA